MGKGIHKFYWMLIQEFSWVHFYQGIFHVLQSYGLFLAFLLFSVSQLFDPESHPELTVQFYGFLLFGVSLLFASLDQHFLFGDDLQEGYMNWLKVQGQNLRTYFFVKVFAKYVTQLVPLMLMTLLFFFSLSISFSYMVYFLCLGFSLGIVVCWGSLLGILFGQSSQRGMSSSYFFGFLLLPLLIPTILVGVECMKALVMGQFCGYYLGMQAGLFMVTLSVSLVLAPFVLNQVE